MYSLYSKSIDKNKTSSLYLKFITVRKYIELCCPSDTIKRNKIISILAFMKLNLAYSCEKHLIHIKKNERNLSFNTLNIVTLAYFIILKIYKKNVEFLLE